MGRRKNIEKTLLELKPDSWSLNYKERTTNRRENLYYNLVRKNADLKTECQIHVTLLGFPSSFKTMVRTNTSFLLNQCKKLEDHQD